MLNTAFYPCLQIRNSAFVLYYQSAEPIQRSRKQFKAQEFLRSTYKGEISKCSKRNITRAINLLIQDSPLKWYTNPITNRRNNHRLTFLTLTFSCSEIISLKVGYEKSLKPLLRWLKEVKNVVSYVWKAEFQKRGQLHYHITTNEFIRHDELRNKWNYIQKSNGYLQEYWEKHKHYDPNSSDIHAVYKIKDIESYLIKYVSKSVGQSNDKGKIWGCSENLRGKQYFTYEYIDENNLQALKEAEDKGAVRMLDFVENCEFYKIEKGKDFTIMVNKEDRKLISQYVKSDFKKTTEFLTNLNITK